MSESELKQAAALINEAISSSRYSPGLFGDYKRNFEHLAIELRAVYRDSIPGQMPERIRKGRMLLKSAELASSLIEGPLFQFKATGGTSSDSIVEFRRFVIDFNRLLEDKQKMTEHLVTKHRVIEDDAAVA